MKKIIDKIFNRFSPETLTIVAIVMTLGLLIFQSWSFYKTLSCKYVVSQNGYTYTGRMLRSNHGLSMFTEDGRYIVLYDVSGPIEIKLKDNK